MDDKLKATVNKKLKLVNITPSDAITLFYQYIDEHNCLPFTIKDKLNTKGEVIQSIHADINSVILILSAIVNQMVVRGKVDKSLMCSSVAALKISREFLREGKTAFSTGLNSERCISLIIDVVTAIDSAVIQCEIISAADQDGYVLLEYSSVAKINAALSSLELYGKTWSRMRLSDF